MPLLQRDGDSVITRLSQGTLQAQTETLIQEYGAARVLDARRPKFVQNMQPVTAVPAQKKQTVIGYLTTLMGAGLLVATD